MSPRRTTSRIFPVRCSIGRLICRARLRLLRPEWAIFETNSVGRVLQRRIIRAYVARYGSVWRSTYANERRKEATVRAVLADLLCDGEAVIGRDGAAGRRRSVAPSWLASSDHKPRPGRRSNSKTCRIWDIREVPAEPLREHSDHVHWRAAQPTSRTPLPRSARSVREIARV
jgi:hypothetical protein